MQCYFINFVAETIAIVAIVSVFIWLQNLFGLLSFLCVWVCVCVSVRVYEREKFLSPSPLSGTVRCSRHTHIFSVSDPALSLLQKSLVLCWRRVLTNNISELCVLVATRVLLFGVPLIIQRKVCLCASSCTNQDAFL